MEKIKKVLRPGGDKDDEVMYGDPQQQKVTEDAPQLSTDPQAQKESHGILRQVLNPHGDKYSEQSYGTTAHATEDVEKDKAGELKTDPEVEKKEKSQGVFRQIFNPGGDKYSEQSYGTTAEKIPQSNTSSATPGTRISSLKKADLDETGCVSIKSGKEGPYAGGADTLILAQPGPSSGVTASQSNDGSNFGTMAGVGATGAAGAGGLAFASRDSENTDHGMHRENKGDDVTGATYTSRSYALPSGRPADPSHGPNVDSSQDRREPEEEESHTVRDTSLAGAGTIIGAGAVGAGALAAQEDKHRDPEVDSATYTSRSHYVGTSSDGQAGHSPMDAGQTNVSPMDARHEEIDPQNTNNASRMAPHVPGEFPTESGQDPHVPGGFPETPAATEENKGHDVGSGAAVASAMGLTAVGGGAAAAAAGSKSSDEQPKATEKDMHPGGSGFPMESSQGSDSNTGRNAGIAAGAVGGAAAAGGLTYAATRGDDQKAPEPAPTQKFEDTTGAPGKTSTTTTTTTKTTTSQQKPTEQKATEEKPEEKDDSNFGRNAAIAGGATAAAGAGAAYYATRDDEGEQEEEKKGLFDKLKEKKQERDEQKEQDKAEKEREKAEKERQKEKEKADKENEKAAKEKEKADKEREKAEKEKQKEDEKAAKEREKAEKEREKEREKAEKERHKEAEKEEKEREKSMSKEEKKEYERQKKEAWEKENAARLAAYERGELGPQDVITDQQPAAEVLDREGGMTTEGGIAAGAGAAGVAGAGAATYAATRGEDHKTSTNDQGHNVLHKKSADDTSQSSDKKPSLVDRILHPNRTKREEEERRASSEAARSSTDTPSKSAATGTSATPTTQQTGSELEPAHTREGLNTQTLAPGEAPPEGYITLHHEGAHPDAPHVVVRDSQ